MEVKPGFYSNPAFCQQSEFYTQKGQLSPQRSVRQSPVGAQTSHVVFDNSLSDIHPEECVDNIEEQEFYEEVIVDDKGFIKGKQVVVVAQNQEGKKYIQVPQEEKKGTRYGTVQQTQYNSPQSLPNQSQKNRYEYIPMQQQQEKIAITRSQSKRIPRKVQEEHVEVVPGVVHRYAIIEPEDETELTNRNERYALVPVSELNQVVGTQKKNRYEYIPDSSPAKVHQNMNRYEYIQTTPSKTGSRYEPLQQSTPQASQIRPEYIPQNSYRPGTNPIATQKLVELLTTPRKSRILNQATPQKVLSPHSPRKLASPPLSPIPKDPFQTPRSTPQRIARPQPNSKVQQKLNYALASKQMAQDKRSTAIVPPMCSSPIQSVYSETTYSQKSESWMNLSLNRPVTGKSLTISSLVLFLCGNGISGLSFYMISLIGQWYYLDLALAAGFACAIMGMAGCRSRNVYWLPNRNYLSGYLLLNIFSILTCVGLLLLKIQNPQPGKPLADVTSGAVCGFSVMILILSITGLISSYCCKYPPPDNRVQHCSPSLTV
ncbi:sanpodo [Rhynchophorus ferrugineus]|uniref:sanpodo n=1 Tax=Rhynchophorus ferrugineus TaxID=354439 RepID=UPI003FCCF457